MLDGILRAVGRIEKLASTIAAVFMFAIMMIVFSDVIMRYAFNRPFSWAYDLISLYLMAGVFFLVTLAWVGFAWWRRRVGEEKAAAVAKKPQLLNVVLSVLVVLGGVAATWSVTAAGHSGATSVWEKTKP